jgi:hypothetical protein
LNLFFKSESLANDPTLFSTLKGLDQSFSKSAVLTNSLTVHPSPKLPLIAVSEEKHLIDQWDPFYGQGIRYRTYHYLISVTWEKITLLNNTSAAGAPYTVKARLELRNKSGSDFTFKVNLRADLKVVIISIAFERG